MYAVSSKQIVASRDHRRRVAVAIRHGHHPPWSLPLVLVGTTTVMGGHPTPTTALAGGWYPRRPARTVVDRCVRTTGREVERSPSSLPTEGLPSPRIEILHLILATSWLVRDMMSSSFKPFAAGLGAFLWRFGANLVQGSKYPMEATPAMGPRLEGQRTRAGTWRSPCDFGSALSDRRHRQ